MNLPTQWTSHSTAQSATAPREAAVWQCPPSGVSPVRETYYSHLSYMLCEGVYIVRMTNSINYLYTLNIYLYIQFIWYFNVFYTHRIHDKIKTNKQTNELK